MIGMIGIDEQTGFGNGLIGFQCQLHGAAIKRFDISPIIRGVRFRQAAVSGRDDGFYKFNHPRPGAGTECEPGTDGIRSEDAIAQVALANGDEALVLCAG